MLFTMLSQQRIVRRAVLYLTILSVLLVLFRQGESQTINSGNQGKSSLRCLE